MHGLFVNDFIYESEGQKGFTPCFEGGIGEDSVDWFRVKSGYIGLALLDGRIACDVLQDVTLKRMCKIMM